MKIEVTSSFKDKLNLQIDFIAKDKPQAARKFKRDLLSRLEDIQRQPYAYRKSIFFDRKDIRDLIFKGYIIVFKINKKENKIEVFGFIKYETSMF